MNVSRSTSGGWPPTSYCRWCTSWRPGWAWNRPAKTIYSSLHLIRYSSGCATDGTILICVQSHFKWLFLEFEKNIIDFIKKDFLKINLWVQLIEAIIVWLPSPLSLDRPGVGPHEHLWFQLTEAIVCAANLTTVDHPSTSPHWHLWFQLIEVIVSDHSR